MKNSFYGTIDGLDKKVSRIFYGTASKPYNEGGEGSGILDQMLELGINAIDCARVYSKAETSLGRWIDSRENREKLVLLTKCGHPDIPGKKRVNEKEMKKDLAKSLQELRTDYIDIYLLHRDDPDISAGVAVEIFNSMYSDGKIKIFGGSNWTFERIQEANEYAYAHNLRPFSVSSPNFCLAEQIRDPWGGGCVTISGKAKRSAREWYQENQMPVIAYSSLGRGFFSGRLKSPDNTADVKKVLDSFAVKGYYCEENLGKLRRCEELAARKGTTVSQIAMSWIFCQNLNMYAIVSTSSPERMKLNISALELKLTPEEVGWLEHGE